MDPNRGLVEVKPTHNSSGDGPKSFTFDAVYDWKWVHFFDLFSNFSKIIFISLNLVPCILDF
jgi:hypothetical protein